MTRWSLAWGCVLSLLGASVASAQAPTPVRNPTTVVLTVSSDHATVTRYELGFFQAGAIDPVQTSDLGTGAADANWNLQKPLPSYPIGVIYIAKARAYANDLASDWSPSSDPFYRTPAPPSAVAIR